MLQEANNALQSLGLTISDHQGNCAIAPTGERYITLTAFGERAEGETITGPRYTRENAGEAYLGALRAYAAGKAGTVYWRRHPELEHWSTGWNVYSRLLISDKPVISADEAA